MSSRLKFNSRFPGYNFPVISRLDSSGQAQWPLGSTQVMFFGACIDSKTAEIALLFEELQGQPLQCFIGLGYALSSIRRSFKQACASGQDDGQK